MFDKVDNLVSILMGFGLSQDEVMIYLVLWKKGDLSALNISRETKLSRTKVYRLLDKLIEKGLVSQRVGDWGMKFVASDPMQLEIIVKRQEDKVKLLREQVEGLIEKLRAQVKEGKGNSKVLFYEGVKGLERVNFNLLRAKGEFLSMEVDSANMYLPQKVAEELRRSLVEKRIRNRLLTNKKELSGFTNIKEYLELVEARWIEKEKLRVRGDVFIYNEVVAMCNYIKGEVFCVEIYNPNLAAMQREMFESVWQGAERIKVG